MFDDRSATDAALQKVSKSIHLCPPSWNLLWAQACGLTHGCLPLELLPDIAVSDAEMHHAGNCNDKLSLRCSHLYHKCVEILLTALEDPIKSYNTQADLWAWVWNKFQVEVLSIVEHLPRGKAQQGPSTSHPRICGSGKDRALPIICFLPPWAKLDNRWEWRIWTYHLTAMAGAHLPSKPVALPSPMPSAPTCPQGFMKGGV